MKKSLFVLIVFLVTIVLIALMITTTDVHGAEPFPIPETGYPAAYDGYPAPISSDPTIETKTIFSTPEPIKDFSEKINSSFSSISQKNNDLIKVISRGFYIIFYIQ